MTDYSTHSLGVMCASCRQVLEDDECCDYRHGYGYQEPNEWAFRTWPDHQCFRDWSAGR